ncbi:hypothetical protein ACFX2I_030019 [Malus domestica]
MLEINLMVKGLQRSERTFRRQGSSGLICDDKWRQLSKLGAVRNPTQQDPPWSGADRSEKEAIRRSRFSHKLWTHIPRKSPTTGYAARLEN